MSEYFAILFRSAAVGCLFTLLSFNIYATESIGYSGRLVNPDGRPVTGDVDLFIELAYSGSTTSILCSKSYNDVPLSNGLFYLKVDFDCGLQTINQVLTNVPVNESVVIRVTNNSVTPVKVYPFQSFYSVPLANVAQTSKQLTITGTTAGDVLKWDGSKWVAGPEAGTGGGTITNIATGTGLTGGPITASGTISIANDGVGNTQLADGILRSKIANGTANYFVVNNVSGELSEISSASAFTLLGLGSAATANIGLASGNVVGVANLPSCLSGQFMRVTAPPTVTFSCDYPDDTTKLALDGSDAMSGTLDMGTHKIINVVDPTADQDAATKKYVDDQVGGVNVSQWTTGTSLIYYNGGSVGIGRNDPGEALDVVGNIRSTGKIILKSDTANYVELQAPASLAASLSFKLPATLGTAGQVLARVGVDGSLEWKDVATNATNLAGDITGPLTATEIATGAVDTAELANSSVTSVKIADSTIVNADIAASAAIAFSKLAIADGDIPQAKVNGLVTALLGKEPAITTGTSAQYIRGDKTLATLSTSVVPEGTNLYFTEPLVLGTDLAGYAVSSGALSASDTILQAFGKLEGQINATASAYVNTSGDTMSGNLNMGAQKIVNLADPDSAQEAATKAYVDTTISGSSVWGTSGIDIYRAGGYVGIGATSPTEKLEVLGNVKITGANAGRITLYNAYSGTPSNPGIEVANETGALTFQHNSNGGATNVKGPLGVGTFAPKGFLHATDTETSFILNGNLDSDGFNAGANWGTTVGTSLGLAVGWNRSKGGRETNFVNLTSGYTPGGFSFDTWDGTSYVNHMVLKGDGNLGLGTPAPAARFESRSTEIENTHLTRASGNVWMRMGRPGTAGMDNAIFGWDDTLKQVQIFISGDSPGEGLNIASSGNIGIGKTVPAYKLDVSGAIGTTGSVYPSMYFQESTNSTISTIYYDSVSATKKLSFRVNSGATDYLNITEAGNIGIGTSAPVTKLHVVGNNDAEVELAVTDTGPAGIEIRSMVNVPQYIDFTPNSSSNSGFGTPDWGGRIIYNNLGANDFQFYTNGVGSPNMVIASSGNVGIGTTSPSEKLEVTGNVRAVSFISTSDKRLKTNLKKTSGLKTLQQLTGYRFDWIDSGETEYGVMAQDVEKVMPEAVVTHPESGTKSVKYNSLIAPVIEAIKELYAKVSGHEISLKEKDREIQELKKKNDELEKRLLRLETKMQTEQASTTK